MAKQTQRPCFEHVYEKDPILEAHENRSGFWLDQIGGRFLNEHVSQRYGERAYKFKWNIGIIGFGDVGKESLVALEYEREESNNGSGIGHFYVITSKPKENEGKIKDDLNVRTGRHRNKTVLGVDWKNLQSKESQASLEKIVDETDICIITADVGKEEFERLCHEAQVDPMNKEKRREMKTRANIGWANQIAKRFKDYKGIVLVVSNLSDDLAYVFGRHMRDPYRAVGMSYVDTARMEGLDFEEIRSKILQNEIGIEEEYSEISQRGEDVLKNIAVFSVGSHNNPYPLIYYKGHQVTGISIDDLSDEMEKLRKWGFKLLERGDKTDKQTGKAVARTVIQMMDGLRPVPVSLLFDYRDDRKKEGYFTLPVMFGLERVERKGKTRFVPRPCVIKPQLDLLMEQDGFRELVDQRAAELRAATYNDGTPMFPEIEDWEECHWTETLDLGYLYVAGKRNYIVNAYSLSQPIGEGVCSMEISPFKSSSVEIEDIERIIGQDGDLTVCLSRNQNDEDIYRVLEYCEQTGKEFNFGCKTNTAKQSGKILYVGLNDGDKGRIVCLDLDEESGPHDIVDKINTAHEVALMSTFEVIDYEGRLSLCVAGEDGNLYLYDAETGELMHSATRDSNLSFSTLKAVEKDGKTVVLGSLRHKLSAWYVGEEKMHDLPFKTRSIYFDAAVEGGKIKLTTLNKGEYCKTNVELRVYGGLDGLLAESSPQVFGLNESVNGIDFVGTRIAVMAKGKKYSLVRVLEENDAGLSEVGEFKLEDAHPMKKYSWSET